MLGYAEFGELKQIITMKNNWGAFEPYFSSKSFIDSAFDQIIPLRNSGMHASQREFDLLELIGPLSYMAQVVKSFHPATADRIEELVRETVNRNNMPDLDDSDSAGVLAGSKMLTNLGDFERPNLVGREQYLQELQDFWGSDYKRVISITGQGGVGKTALLESFVSRLLETPWSSGTPPDPEAIIYLTAKDNYLDFMRPPGKSRQFRTFRTILETTLEIVEEEHSQETPIEELKRKVYSLAENFRILFAIDNLESLANEEYDEFWAFFGEIPKPSKVIVTTRIERHSPRWITLEGLPFADARDLLLSRLSEDIFVPSDEEQGVIDELVDYTNGFPLALVYCANAYLYGMTFEQILEKFRGKELYDLLEFSFESSVGQLKDDHLQVLLYLALSKTSRARKDMLKFVEDDKRLDEVIRTLQQMNFIKRAAEERKQIRFVIDNSMLRDYVKKRVPELLHKQDYAWVRKHADVLPGEAESPIVQIAIERSLSRARDVAPNWGEAVKILESARRSWGDDPRLLKDLGYCYYRIKDRFKARPLLEKVIDTEYETAEVHLHLSYVLFYEGLYDLALTHAQRALILRSIFPKAEQVAGQCLLQKVERETLLIDDQLKSSILERALSHLRRSLIADEKTSTDFSHNDWSRGNIRKAERMIDELNRSMNAGFPRLEVPGY